MSTLAVDFSKGREREEYLSHHIRFWVAWYWKGDAAQAVSDMWLALKSDPTMPEWADWASVRAKGQWLRERGECVTPRADIVEVSQ